MTLKMEMKIVIGVLISLLSIGSYAANPFAVTNTNTDFVQLAASDDRQDRRQERGRSDERHDKRDCRQEEGRTGQDKRECKQEEVRDGVRGNKDHNDNEG
ncbi:MAG: hypothetical protein QNL15_17690 [Pseudomonadales bacterium]|jgi:hypothetical protein|tara:strand:- start:6893 stop:7192 length:300 start_codon:yes stop_codon:yes gene_type:complete